MLPSDVVHGAMVCIYNWYIHSNVLISDIFGTVRRHYVQATFGLSGSRLINEFFLFIYFINKKICEKTQEYGALLCMIGVMYIIK